MVHLHGQTTALYTAQDRRLHFFMDSRLRGNEKIPAMPARAGTRESSFCDLREVQMAVITQ